VAQVLGLAEKGSDGAPGAAPAEPAAASEPEASGPTPEETAEAPS
jgi:hypothetical protein